MTPLFTNEQEIPPVKVWLAIIQGFGWLVVVSAAIVPFLIL